jgi:hypothetical protein
LSAATDDDGPGPQICGSRPPTAGMRRRRSRGLVPVARVILPVLLLAVARLAVFAQDVTEPALKAAFIYNFAKFTDWPGEIPAGIPFMMCVLGDTAVGDALERAVAGRVLTGRPIVMSRVLANGPKRACSILYVSGVSAAEAGLLVAEVRDVPVLTISDVDGFTQVGGIAEFFFEASQLRFRIRIESAKRAGLQISSRLLIMARPK